MSVNRKIHLQNSCMVKFSHVVLPKDHLNFGVKKEISDSGGGTPNDHQRWLITRQLVPPVDQNFVSLMSSSEPSKAVL